MMKQPILKTILDAAAVDGAGSAIRVGNYTDKEITVDTNNDGNAEMDLYIQYSYAETEPDWDSVQAVDNEWYYARLKDLNNGDYYAGTTGLGALLAGANLHNAYNVEVNNNVWINALIDNYVAGSVTVRVQAKNPSN